MIAFITSLFWNSKISGNDKISNVFAGVGKPINESDWLVEMLNLASLYADASVISNPKNGKKEFWANDELKPTVAL